MEFVILGFILIVVSLVALTATGETRVKGHRRNDWK